MAGDKDPIDEYDRVDTRLRPRANKASKRQRQYPGYEDYSPKGRAQIKAFNAAGGAEFLNEDTDVREYKAASEHAQDARRKSGTKQESARGRAKKKTAIDAMDEGIKRAKRDE